MPWVAHGPCVIFQCHTCTDLNLRATEPQGRVLFPVSLAEGVLGLCSAVLVPLHFDAVEERGRWTAAPLVVYFVSLGCLQVPITILTMNDKTDK